MPAHGPVGDGGRLENSIMNENVFNILGVDDDRGILDIYRDILESVLERAASSLSAADTECLLAPCFKYTSSSQPLFSLESELHF